MAGTHSGILVDYADGRLARAMTEVSSAGGTHSGVLYDFGNGTQAIAAVKTALSGGTQSGPLVDYANGNRAAVACMVAIGAGVRSGPFVDYGDGRVSRAVVFVDGASATRAGALYDLGSSKYALAVARLDIDGSEVSDGPLLTDSFDRADDAGSLGNADTGQTWTAVTGTWGITSNAAYSSTAGVAAAVINAGVSDLDFSVTITRAASNTGAYFRVSSAGANGYRLRMDGTNIYLEAGYNANTVLTQAALTWGTRTLRVVANGADIEVFADAVSRLTFTEVSAQTGTYVGLYKNSAATTTHTYNDLSVSAP